MDKVINVENACLTINKNVILDNVIPEHLTAVINKLEETGCKIEINNKKIVCYKHIIFFVKSNCSKTQKQEYKCKRIIIKN